jgi:PEP-CTERM motif
MQKPMLFWLAAAAITLPCAAQAGIVGWSFQYSGPGVSASGLLTTDDNFDGSFDILAVTGQRNGDPILGLLGTAVCGPTLPGNTTGFRGCLFSDNLLFEVPPLLRTGGFNFDIGGDKINVYYDGGVYRDLSLNAYNPCVNFSNDCGSAGVTDVQFSIQRVPEPATWALAGLALLGVAGSRRSQARAAA